MDAAQKTHVVSHRDEAVRFYMLNNQITVDVEDLIDAHPKVLSRAWMRQAILDNLVAKDPRLTLGFEDFKTIVKKANDNDLLFQSEFVTWGMSKAIPTITAIAYSTPLPEQEVWVRTCEPSANEANDNYFIVKICSDGDDGIVQLKGILDHVGQHSVEGMFLYERQFYHGCDKFGGPSVSLATLKEFRKLCAILGRDDIARMIDESVANVGKISTNEKIPKQTGGGNSDQKAPSETAKKSFIIAIFTGASGNTFLSDYSDEWHHACMKGILPTRHSYLKKQWICESEKMLRFVLSRSLATMVARGSVKGQSPDIFNVECSLSTEHIIDIVINYINEWKEWK